VQSRNLRRFEKLLWQQRNLKDALTVAKREAAASQEEAAHGGQFAATLLGNVWRIIHEEPKEQWAAIFGQMYAEHYRGATPPSSHPLHPRSTTALWLLCRCICQVDSSPQPHGNETGHSRRQARCTLGDSSRYILHAGEQRQAHCMRWWSAASSGCRTTVWC
jgi:hypothetical protein